MSALKFTRVSFVALAASLCCASGASAYSHQWNPSSSPKACNPVSNDVRCYDNQGTTYNPWYGVQVTGPSGGLPEICAKAVTLAGNLRSSQSGHCLGSGSNHFTLHTSTTPDSRAYVSWSGYNGSNALSGYATT